MSNGQIAPAPHERTVLLEAWKVSEDVAMHFNGMLLGFRLKAIGGIAVGAVGAVISTGFKFGGLANRAVISTLFAGLAVIWLLIWAADFRYYYRLLAGAVDELLRLERRLGNVHLSHLIERRVRGGAQPKDDIESILPYKAVCAPKYPCLAIWVFYVVPAAILIGLAILFASNVLTISPQVAGCDPTRCCT